MICIVFLHSFERGFRISFKRSEKRNKYNSATSASTATIALRAIIATGDTTITQSTHDDMIPYSDNTDYTPIPKHSKTTATLVGFPNVRVTIRYDNRPQVANGGKFNLNYPTMKKGGKAKPKGKGGKC